MAEKKKADEPEETEDKAEGAAEGAPKTETPEDPAVPAEMKVEEPPLETPEDPAVPEQARSGRLGITAPPIALSGGTAATTYTSQNPNGDPASTYDIDTTVGSAPADRPSTFSPPNTGKTIVAPAAAADYGQASQMASRPSVFDPAVTTQVYIDPGLGRFG